MTRESGQEVEQRHLAVIERQRRALERAQAKVTRALSDRDSAVQAALAAGVPRQAIADAAGLHRRRIYQVRDGSR